MLENTFTLHTNGRGYWSSKATAVTVEALDLQYITNDKDFGELCIHFNTNDWDTKTDGLIYTDTQFKQDLMAFVKEQGLVVDLCYSEQGMQGDNYVSLDVGAEFLAIWASKFGVHRLGI
jgi:hypothetical protein